MKNSVALGWGDRAILSGHLGDLERPRAIDAFVQTAESLQVLYRVAPEEVVADTHPDYASTRWAREFVQARPGRSLLTVPHHRAHASALAAEHSDVKRWLVLTWDGVGLGEDGTLWGGEAFHGAPGRWRRVGSFRPSGFSVQVVPVANRRGLPMGCSGRAAGNPSWRPIRSRTPLGSETSVVRKPPRSGGCSMRPRLSSRGGHTTTLRLRARWSWKLWPTPAPRRQYRLVPRGVCVFHCTKTTRGLLRLNWRPFISLFRSASTLDPRIAAAGFHAALADAAVRLALRVYEETPFDALGLSGGVFQNRRLTQEVWSRCASSGLDVRIARQVPMNDGGLAYGQLVEAVATEG